MPNVFLYGGETPLQNVKLRDPTQVVTSTVNVSIVENQSAQSEAISVSERYSAIISESQAAQSESVTIAERYSATISESQSIQSESVTAEERYTASVAESQATQAEAITATVPISITADIAEGQAQQTESITAVKAIPAPQRPVQLVGMGGQWYTYYDLLRMGKKKLEESKTIPPVPKKRQPELTPAFSAALQRLGSKPRRRVAFRSLDITPVQDSMKKYVHHEGRKTRARRDKEAVEV
jgi:hypothetical protein